MRTPRVSAEEQYRLIMECRKSGLSDQQWCLNNDIKPGTFYNWVKRLRQKGCIDLPKATDKELLKSVPQEVVKIQIDKPAVIEPASVDITPTSSAMESVMWYVFLVRQLELQERNIHTVWLRVNS